MWRRPCDAAEVLLGHFGGPFWARKDAGAWGIPKGLIEKGETPEDAARREFREEMGVDPPPAPLTPLGQIKQSGGKLVDVFAVEGAFDCANLVSNIFTVEWPPRSGQLQAFPEVDRVAWFGIEEARAMILPSQLAALDMLERLVLID